MNLRKWLRGRKSTEQQGLGVAFSSQAIAVAVVRGGDGEPVLDRCSILPLKADGDREQVFAAAVDGMSLNSQRCVCALSAADYRLTLLEAPSAGTEAGRNELLQLKMQNMSGFDLRDATFEFFPLPDGADQVSHVFIAAAERNTISGVNELAAKNGLKLAAIDIVELGIRNLVTRHDQAAAGVAVLVLADAASRLWLFRGEELYVARKLRASMAGLNVGNTAPAGGELALLSDNDGGEEQELSVLLSQINRSFSYYQRNLHQEPISTLLVASESAALQGRQLSSLVARLNAELNAETKLFDLSSGFTGLPTFEAAYKSAVENTPGGSVALLTAIGSALRSLDSEPVA